MAECVPFRGWRYPTTQQRDLSALVAPPYDVIGPEEDARLHETDAHNIIHLIRSHEQVGDTEEHNAYTRARDLLQTWCEEGVLERDAVPTMYIYEQGVEIEGRMRCRVGFISLLKLVEPNAGELFFHERTFPAPRADRLKLMQTVRAQLSPVFTMFSEKPQGSVMSLLRRWMAQAAPDAIARFQQEAHRLWRIDAPEQIAALQAAMQDKILTIADGHHRYEAAWMNRAQHPYVLHFCSWLEDPDLVIFPLHREMAVLPEGINHQHLLDRLEKCGEVRRVGSTDEMLAALAADDAPGVFGYYGNGVAMLVHLDETLRQQLHKAYPGLGELDVVLLHEGILPRVLGERAAQELQCTYVKDGQEAIAHVDAGTAAAVWLVRPINPSTVEQLARRCIRLPQKSTYFYPKLLTGIVLHKFDDA